MIIYIIANYRRPPDLFPPEELLPREDPRLLEPEEPLDPLPLEPLLPELPE